MVSGNRFAPQALALLRIVSAFLFLQHGTAKFFGIPYQAKFDGLQVMSISGVAGILEIVGGLMLLIGLFTRPTAFVMSGFMAVAYFMAHGSKGNVLMPLLNGGELAIMFSFVFLFLSAAGAGAWSMDGARRGSAA